MNSGKVHARIKTLNDGWEQYQQNDKILQSLKNEDNRKDPYFRSEVYQLDYVQELYTDSLGDFFHLKNTLERAENPPIAPQVNVAALPANQQNNNGQQAAPAIHHVDTSLPKIPLPTFNGDQLSWESFKAKFQSRVVNNRNIAAPQKLELLLSCLQGEASRRLGSLDINEENYTLAWQALTRRYDNQKLRLATHLNRLISTSPINPKAPRELTRILDTFEESIRALTALTRPVEHWDDWFVQLVVSKLDHPTRNDWEKSREGNDDFTTYAQLTTFLENRARTQEAARASSTSSTSNSRIQTAGPSPSKKAVSAHVASTGEKRPAPNCVQCPNEQHFTYKCPPFLQMTVPQRRAFLSSSGNCYNCFSTGHRADKCPSKYSCRTCNGRHHTLIHLDSTANSGRPGSGSAGSSQPQSTATQVTACTTSVGGRALIATALVTLHSDVSSITVRALIDPGADESFVTEHVAQSLQLRKSRVSTTISGVGGESVKAPTSLVAVTLKSNQDPLFSMKIPALVLRKLTNLLPSAQVPQYDWPHLQGLQLADPEFFKPGRIDCILGAEVYGVILQDGLRKGPHPSPIAQKTVFGWILVGSIEKPSNCNSKVSCHRIQQSEPLQDQLRRFWELEETPEVVHLTSEEAECEEHFQRTHSREPDGRFNVRLPFKSSPELPGSKEIAVSRFMALERRLQADPQLYELYSKFMAEYLALGHMEPAPPELADASKVYYIPHHGILKMLNKLRVVFNASQPAKNNKSLNDHLHIGPKLQSELMGVLTRWRFYRYVFTADIVKMFRQFKVHPDDCDWQRILWRSSSDQPLMAYRLRTVTYGTAPAPYLAIRCLHQLSMDEQERFPKGAAILTQNAYVDDNLGGDHNLNSAIQTRDELIQILASAGMQLDKWSANDPTLLQGISSAPTPELSFDEPVSTLGLKWHPQEDTFCFKVATKKTPDAITKKSILSEIASLFDPLGWLAPIVIRAKIYMQELWLRQSSWDSPVDDDVQQAWLSFKADLPDIEKISIPRWMNTPDDPHWELHGFSDASDRAYAAVIYLVMYENNVAYKSIIIAAKSKVAPVKKVTIPRLELCGAKLLAKLIKSMKGNFTFPPNKVFCWSDSTTTLAWIRGGPTRWTTFVANRVSDILTFAPDAKWDHVDTSSNPADIASRGATPTQLQQSTLWWTGPEWLLQGPESWPQENTIVSTDEEKKSCTKVFQVTTAENSMTNWISRYSSLSRLIRHVSSLYRWRKNSHSPAGEKKQTSLTVTHLRLARKAIIRATQLHFFGEEMSNLKKQRPVNQSSHLRSLNPFLDADGLLRVGGRLQNLAGSYDEKHPVIVPKGSHLAKLLIQEVHQLTLHGGAQLVQSTLRRSYWIIHDRSQIRYAIKNCPKCLRYQGQSQHQLMAPLPAVRLQPARPFMYSGVDYAGPYNIRVSKGRGQKSYKGYVSIFVCMVTRAVHIEVVSDYTSVAFLAAFRRFTSRRGLCKQIYCDHGTTFQGASAEVHKLFNQDSQFSKEVQEALKKLEVEWFFIPPKGPHFGGLWESKVKIFKHHLKRVTNNSTLTFEEFETLAVQIEACINSRPLSPMTGDSNDICALTPGHFLIGGPLNLLPDISSVSDPTARDPTCRWLQVQKMFNDFWRRWRLEVLHDLQRRSKWLEPTRNLQVDDIVIIKDDQTPPASWALGRVIECYPGPDGLVRSALLKTSTTTLERPVVKLILLPANLAATKLQSEVSVQE